MWHANRADASSLVRIVGGYQFSRSSACNSRLRYYPSSWYSNQQKCQIGLPMQCPYHKHNKKIKMKKDVGITSKQGKEHSSYGTSVHADVMSFALFHTQQDAYIHHF